MGVAQAAAAAGYDVMVLERDALAAGTSSRSSKLIHGGLRYLESGQFALVRESLRERELLLRLAPSLVKRQKFYIPVYPETSRRPWLMRVGLGLYWLFAGMGSEVRFQTVPKAAWQDLDGLNTDGLQNVFQYWDAQTDDACLTQAVMQSAISLGARLECGAEFEQAVIHENFCDVSYSAGGQAKSCKATVVVNAAGAWAHRMGDRFEPHLTQMSFDNVQGAHLELQGEIERGCYYVEAPGDRRAVFVMPWHNGRTLLGTTEHQYTGDPARVRALPEERDYLLDVYQHYFPGRSIEVLAEWAGLRVLPSAKGGAFNRSRETQLPVDNAERPRVISIIGGKLTVYRATAQQVMQVLKKSLPAVTPRADTSELPLSLAR